MASSIFALLYLFASGIFDFLKSFFRNTYILIPGEFNGQNDYENFPDLIKSQRETMVKDRFICYAEQLRPHNKRKIHSLECCKSITLCYNCQKGKHYSASFQKLKRLLSSPSLNQDTRSQGSFCNNTSRTIEYTSNHQKHNSEYITNEKQI